MDDQPPVLIDTEKPEVKNVTRPVIIASSLVAILLVILAYAILFVFPSAVKISKLKVAEKNLKQIGLALHNYQTLYRTLPAVHLVERDSTLRHSWRVAVAPFIASDRESSEKLLDLIEAEKNRYPPVPSKTLAKWWNASEEELLDRMPEAYRSPFAPADQPKSHTNLFTIQDPKSAFPKGNTFKSLMRIFDGTSDCLLAVQLPHYSKPWTQAADLTFDEAISRIRNCPKPEQILLLLADASVVPLGRLSDQELHNLMTIDGKEPPIFRRPAIRMNNKADP